jgi:hypothetical protein
MKGGKNVHFVSKWLTPKLKYIQIYKNEEKKLSRLHPNQPE